MTSSIIKTIPAKIGNSIEKIAELAKVELIKLRHPVKFSDVPHTMRGFQGGVIELLDFRGRKEYKFTPEKNRAGEDVATPRDLVFYPDKATGELTAYIPRTKFNIEVLANMHGDYVPEILSPKSVKTEVETKRAKKLSSIPFQKKPYKKIRDAYAAEVTAAEKSAKGLMDELKKKGGEYKESDEYLDKIFRPAIRKANEKLVKGGIEEDELLDPETAMPKDI